jgi:FkbM family methyltransferase
VRLLRCRMSAQIAENGVVRVSTSGVRIPCGEHPHGQVKTRRLSNGYKVSYRNDYELEVIYDDIFAKGIYFFETENPEPYIVDCGGHIGLAVLYFKSLYPQARILTFEPNPETFFLLRENILQNNLKSVRAINMALSREETKDAILYVGEDYLKAWDSTNTIERDLWPNMDEYRGIPVRSTRLSSYIDGPVECLKLDIEGAEFDVLDESKSKLNLVGAITLEYHKSASNRSQRKLEKILEILSESGFDCELFQGAAPIRLDSLPRDPVYQLIIKARR